MLQEREKVGEQGYSFQWQSHSSQCLILAWDINYELSGQIASNPARKKETHRLHCYTHRCWKFTEVVEAETRNKESRELVSMSKLIVGHIINFQGYLSKNVYRKRSHWATERLSLID